MVIKKEFTFLSRNGIDNCHACSWAPENGQVKAILQIVHGMLEYVERYEDFANFLANQGFLVVGADHLGHGKTASTDKDLGYFTKHDASTVLVRDVHRLKKIIQEENPGVPYFIMGHSMGSFIMRKYLAMYCKGINGVVLLGSGNTPPLITSFGISLTNFLRFFFGDRHKSSLVNKIVFGSYLKRIPDARTSSDWLTRDASVIKVYRANPLCTFKFSLNGYRALFKLVKYSHNTANFKNLSKDMSILIASGTEDPVGEYGKHPEQIYAQFNSLGIKDVTLKLYDGCRHEILHELNKNDVYNDILGWLNARIK